MSEWWPYGAEQCVAKTNHGVRCRAKAKRRTTPPLCAKHYVAVR